MSISFVNPLALLLLLLIPLVVGVSLLNGRAERTARRAATPRARANRRRGSVSLVLRVLMLVSLVLALAGTQLVRPVDALTVIFLVDGSDSITPAQHEWTLSYLNNALAEQRPDDRAGIVVFGQNALVERVPSQLAALSRFTSTPIGSRTSIAEAIQLGMALFPADTRKRLVLLSDGEENTGQAIEAARFAAARDVTIDVVPLPAEQGDDVLVNALDAPDTAREGQTVTLNVQVQSSTATVGTLQVFADGELVGTHEVEIPEGTTTIPITVPGGEPGFHRYEVRLDAQGDTRAVNNQAAAFTTVQGPPRVLLVASDTSTVDALKRVLETAGARVEVTAPENVPAAQEQLRPYAGVVLVNVMSHDVPRAVQEALPVYVREQGGSLMMVGGRNSFGAGGWRRTPIADVLPVELERKDTEQRPDLGLVLVIDRSGSMSDSGGGGGRTKLDLAKEAVYQATLGMERNDQVGVVVFDTFAEWVLPVQPLPPLIEIEQALGRFQANGGTDIRSGIEPAAQALAGIDAKVRHVILLTDGQAESNYADLITQMRDQGTTISIVSIGADANPELQQIANLGGGRFYRVLSVTDIPRIFLSETIIVAGRDIVEETFTPVIVLPAPVVRGLDTMPPLHGYNATEPRLAARTILAGPENKPILAQWQYGLGSSVAWTSDLTGHWAQDWVTWDQFARFGGGLLDMLLPPQQTEGLALETRTDGDRAILELVVTDEGRPINDVQLQGRLLNPDDEGQTLTFEQVGAGRYRVITPVDTPGVYLAQVAVQDAEGEPLGSVSSGLVVSYSPEYRSRRATPHVLQGIADVTGGRESPTVAQVFEPPAQEVGTVQEVTLPLVWFALALLPLDIAVRRLWLRRSDLAALREYMGGVLRPRRRQPATAQADAETMARLFAARDRARSRHTDTGTGTGTGTDDQQEPPGGG